MCVEGVGNSLIGRPGAFFYLPWESMIRGHIILCQCSVDMTLPRFKTATDLVCLTAPEAAKLLGSTVSSIRQARLGTEKAGHRRPPQGWQKAIAKLARERAGELVKLAEELEG